MRNWMRAAALLTGMGFSAIFGVAGAGAATTVGQTVDPSTGGECSAPATVIQTGPASYTVPSDGVLTSWSYLAAALPPQLRLKVARPVGPDFTFIGQSTLQTPPPNTLSTYPTRIPVEAGDQIGVGINSPGPCYAAADASYTYFVTPNEEPVGSTTTAPAQSGNVQLDIAAQLEADADGDGFGDETQDLCSTDPGRQTACADLTPPETTIESGPSKTDSHKVSFGFASSEEGSAFQCKLKGKKVRRAGLKKYRPCTSEKGYRRVKPGKYKFLVFATDEAGNVDLTPAKQKFKVVKDA